MSIPIAPEYTQIYTPHQLDFPYYSNISRIECSKLSKKNCSKRSDCKFSDEYQICEPTISEQFDLYFLESRRLWRSGVIERLSGVGCDINQFINNIEIFTGKESASESIIITGSIQPTALDKSHRGSKNSNIVIKLTFKPVNPLDNSLEVERAIYQNIITKLISNRNTPNVMSYLGNITCVQTFNKMFTRKQFDTMSSYLNDIMSNGRYNNSIKNFLILERSSGIELQKWIDETRSEYDILSIIFQVVYTLICFGNIGLQHNDLHFGNIFIEDIGRPITLYFVRSPDTVVKLTTRYIAKIYDFDRGSINHLAVPRNLELDKEYCKKYGTCDKFNPKFDFFQFVSVLHQYNLSKVDPIIKNNIKANWISKILDWKNWYAPIMATRSTTYRLSYNETPTDSQLKTPQQALSILLEAPWSDTPFIEEKRDASLPQEIVFTPPPPQIAKIIQWAPISTETHPSLSIILSPCSFDKVTNSKTNKIFEIWDNEGIYKGDVDLLEEIKKVKPSILENILWYSTATMWLSCPQFHRLRKEQRDALLNNNVELIAVVDDIWNMFNNRLPIKIPVIEY